AGLADFGTRLKATFNNVPAGVRLFVSTVNVNNAANLTQQPPVIGGNNQSQTYAQLVTSEAGGDGNATGGAFPGAASSASVGNVPITELSVVNGAASAVWEVVNTNPNQNESLKFAVYVTYIANPGANSPPFGTATANLSFAPAPPAFSASA